jgi:hypothetical protein
MVFNKIKLQRGKGMLRGLLLANILLACVVSTGVAQQAAKVDPAKLVGTWKVDLRPNPEAPASYQQFEVKSIEGNGFTGTFYGSEIKEGRINRDWETVYFAFTTYDGSGPYHHAGKLVGERLEGTSNSVGRKFLGVWRAERER